MEKELGLTSPCLLQDKKAAPLIKGSWSQEQNKQQKNAIVHAGGELVCGMPQP